MTQHNTHTVCLFVAKIHCEPTPENVQRQLLLQVEEFLFYKRGWLRKQVQDRTRQRCVEIEMKSAAAAGVVVAGGGK